MRVDDAHHRCAACGGTFPRTAEFFYFDRHGRVTGYHRACQRAYLAAYHRAHPDRRDAYYARQRARRQLEPAP